MERLSNSILKSPTGLSRGTWYKINFTVKKGDGGVVVDGPGLTFFLLRASFGPEYYLLLMLVLFWTLFCDIVSASLHAHLIKSDGKLNL